ncbi:MAG: DMT family transporter [Enterovibrio sp.]
MPLLIFVTLLWSFSFSLIGVYLAGQVDPWFSTLLRIAFASLLFLPFLRFKEISLRIIAQLMALGAVQLGLMYCFYYQAFLYLTVPEVLLFTIFTPIYITLLYDFWHKSFSRRSLLSAVLAIIGAAIIQYTSVSPDCVQGFFIVQGANFCFALGQVGYKRLMEKENIQLPSRSIFGLFYLGALTVALPAFMFFGTANYTAILPHQWAILFYLGTIASGVGYFLWNKGATKVSAGQLAVMNNALIPMGILVNVPFWNKSSNYTALALGGTIIFASLFICEKFNFSKKNNLIAKTD